MQRDTDVIQEVASFGSAAAAQAGRREVIQSWLLSKISELLAMDADDLDVSEPLSTYGLGSIAAVSLTGDLEVWLGLELAPTLVWEYPTIEALTEYLASEAEAAESGGGA